MRKRLREWLGLNAQNAAILSLQNDLANAFERLQKLEKLDRTVEPKPKIVRARTWSEFARDAESVEKGA